MRPAILLTDHPPRHTKARAVIGGALNEKVAHAKAARAPEWWLTTIGHGPAKRPIRFFPAKQ